MTEKFETWAILELMGHRRLAGKVTEATIGGGSFIRIDVPGNETETTQYYSPGAVYCITPTTEDIARDFATSNQPEPVHRWELKQLPEPVTDAFEQDYPFG
jgi:hypothetical protein